MILNGDNLGERHQDLNSKVSEAAINQANFIELKSQPEENDVDKLFKIELASKYKNIDYILEVLKCGDVFYISRALKCKWMYQDEYSQFINPEYLETNIFPNMSRKMKNKTLSAISMYMRNANRAINFFKYCINAKMNDYAAKFLLFTPDGFKLDLITTKDLKSFRISKHLKQLIGTSFELALAYIKTHNNSASVIQDLLFLYTVSQEEYLNILEYIRNDPRYPQFSRRLGIRISKSILTKHKQRVLNKPVLYVNILHKGILAKHLIQEDVESLAPGLMPNNSYESLNFYGTYKFILEKIPFNKLYGFMRQLYLSKYESDEFEMNIQFYWLKYYEMLNIDEREAWALQHIERDKELHGIKNYMWYKFVSFPKAFSGIKRYIFLTPDKDERSRIVNVLPETARNEKDISEILNYYYGRHVNESEDHKESFLNKMIEIHDIYSFNNECWETFDKLLYSLDVYTTASYVRWEYKFRSLVYHILHHDKNMPEALKEYFDQVSQFYYFDSLIESLTEERKAIVANYFLRNYAEKIESLMSNPDYNTEADVEENKTGNCIKNQIHDLVYKVSSVLRSFKRSNEECPAVVVRFMESHMDVYKDHEMYKEEFQQIHEEDFVRWLKEDIEIAVDGMSEIRCNAYRWNFRLCRLFRKLKVYFSNDVAQEYLKYFIDYLSDVPKGRREYRNIKMAVVGLFYLADPETIICFLDKHVPTSPKIDHKNIDNRVLQVQKAICRLAYHPRPPIPFSVILKYITGDYVHYTLPTLYNYFANLPSSANFIESLLDAPLSIQKHGLRLAFRSYDAEILSPIIISAWKKTKNVSLRMILYEMLFKRILEENHEVQEKLYEVLKLYTSDLNHDDHDNVYSLLVSDNFPVAFKGNFIETAWLTVSKLSNKSVDIQRRISVIRHMEKYIHLIQRDFARIQIIDDHVKDMLFHTNIGENIHEPYIQDLMNSKWHLTARYIVSYNDEVEQQKSLQLLQTIMTYCLQSWNVAKWGTYTVRKFVDEFIRTIMDKDPKTVESCANMIPIYQYVLDSLSSVLKEEEMYLLHWKLKLSITCRDIIHNGRNGNGEIETGKRKKMSSKEIFHAYGEIVAQMVKDAMENSKFYRSFYGSIAEIVKNVARTISEIINENHEGSVYYVCESLIKTQLTETHLLSLFMLPRDPYRYWGSEHIRIITEIKKQALSKEIQCFLYNKYVLSDYQVRHYI